jgi:hypothetical protein
MHQYRISEECKVYLTSGKGCSEVHLSWNNESKYLAISVYGSAWFAARDTEPISRSYYQMRGSKRMQRLKIQDLQAQLHEETFPTFIYSYTKNTDQLHRTSLVTGEQSRHRVPSYTFKTGCCWSEGPGGSLLITGGGFPDAVGKVESIDTRREFAVSYCPPMLTPRSCHAAVYHTPYLYLLGGYNGITELSECERYVCAENRWEALLPLPRACSNPSGVGVERSLYALGGIVGSYLDLVQKLSLDSLTWELMQLRLPHAGCNISCFKLRDTEVYLVVNNTLYSFTDVQVRSLKTLAEDIRSFRGVSYYKGGILYSSNGGGAVQSYEIGSF